jgi:stage III sporulation protein AG
MDYLRKVFDNGDKKKLMNLGLAFAVGILLIISSNTLFRKDISEKIIYQEEQEDIVNVIKQPKIRENTFEENLERRLEDILSGVYGAGNVQVMLTIAHGKEIVLASNTTFEEASVREVDSEGGVRETYSVNSKEQNIIIKDSNNVDKPLILKQIEPEVEGVLIIAEGGGDVTVRAELIRATQTVLGIPSHRVHVLQMK